MNNRFNKRIAMKKQRTSGSFALVMGFVILVSLLPSGAKAQYPWAGAPKNIENVLYPGDSIPHIITLKLDTLYTLAIDANNPDKGLRALVNTWYSGPDKYGYGYIDENGRPYGKWHYFMHTANGYEKFCEGTYLMLTPANLILEKRFEDQLTTAEKQNQKSGYLEFSVANWLFTGEWIFYKHSKVFKRLVLDNILFMEFNEVINDKGEVITVTVSGDQFKGRLRQAGNIRSSTNF